MEFFCWEMILREKVSEHYLELKTYITALGSGTVCLTNVLLNELILVTKRELGDDGTLPSLAVSRYLVGIVVDKSSDFRPEQLVDTRPLTASMMKFTVI
jgi:hypothetical protein